METQDSSPEEITIDIPGLRLAALAWGPPDGRPVLALHGWLDNAASFEALAPMLADCRTVALDLPGHGHSDHRPAGARYHFIDYVGDVLAAMDALDWRRCILLGHSLGGAVASVLAGAVPDRVERLVLVEAIGPIAARPGEAPEQFARGWRGLGGLDAKQTPVYADIEEGVAARVKATGMSPEAARPIVSRGLVESDAGFTWRTDPRLTVPSLQRLSESQVREYLASISAPVLLVAAGSENRALDARTLRERTRCIGRLELCTLGGSHHLHLEDARSVARVMAPFLAREAA